MKKTMGNIEAGDKKESINSQKVEVKSLKEKKATFTLVKKDNFGLAVINTEGKESLLAEAYEGKTPLSDFIENLDYGDRVELTLVVL